MGHGRHQIWNHFIALVEPGDVAGAPTVSNLLSAVIALGSKRRTSEDGKHFETTHNGLGEASGEGAVSSSFLALFCCFEVRSLRPNLMHQVSTWGVPVEHPKKKAADFVGFGAMNRFFTLLHAPNLVLDTSLGCFSQFSATIPATQDPVERFFSANDWHQGFCLMFCEDFSLGGSTLVEWEQKPGIFENRLLNYFCDRSENNSQIS